MDVTIESKPVPLKKIIVNPPEIKYNYLDNILKKDFKNKFKQPITLIEPKITLKLSKN